MKSLRILHVSPFLSERMGGIPRVAMDLSRELARRGHEVNLYSTNTDWNDNLDIPLGVPVAKNGYHARYFPVRSPRRFNYSPALARALREDLTSHDVVHIHSLYRHSSTVAAGLCRKHGKPYVLGIHNILSPWVRFEKQLVKAVYEWAFDRDMVKHAAAVLFNSPQEWEDARRYMDFPHGVVIPNGVNPEDFSSLPPRFEAEERWPEITGRCVIVFMARVARVKGLDRLLEAYAELLRDDRLNLHLLVAGADEGGYLAVTRAQAERLGLDGRITFAGHVQGHDKRVVLARADIFALTSYSESFGIAPVEAMACGVPVVITRAVKIADEVMEAGAGRAVAGAHDEIVRALRELALSGELRAALGERARALVQERFTWDIVGEQVENLYHRVIRGATTRAD